MADTTLVWSTAKHGSSKSLVAGESHPLMENQTLRLVAWKIAGKFWQVREYQEKLQNLLHVPEQEAHSLIINRPGESGLVGVVNNRLILFDVL